MDDILKQLAEILHQRKQADPEKSYVAQLYAQGLDVILKKVGEEATETVIAAKNGEASQLIYEIADLWFHTLVLLAHHDLGPDAVLAELAQRLGTSGLTEKQSRQQT